MRQLERIVCALPVLVVAGMAGCYSGQAWTSADSWYSPIEDEELAEMSKGNQWKYVDFDRVHPVSGRKVPAAVTLLVERAWVSLTSEEAASLVGGTLPQNADPAWYLLRGVVLTTNGRFSVSTLDGRVLVHYGCLGTFPTKMQRHPVVVDLENPPTDVYVECSMAQ